MSGWWIVARGTWDDPAFTDEKFTEREAWLWLHEMAAYEPHKVRSGYDMISVSRGQIPTSYRKLSEKWQWGNRRIKKYLELLVSDGKITISDNAGFTIITICNYDFIDDRNSAPYTPSTTGVTTQVTTHPTTGVTTQVTTNINKGNNINNKISIPVEEESSIDPPLVRKNAFLKEKPAALTDGWEERPLPVPNVIEMWNEILHSGGGMEVQLTAARKKKINQRCGDVLKTGGEWLNYFRRIAADDFTAGRRTDWKATIDWALEQKNVIKMLEGGYGKK